MKGMKKKEIFNFIKIRSNKIKKEAKKVRRKIERIIIKRNIHSPSIQISLSGNIIKQGTQRMNYQASKTFESVLNKMEYKLVNNYKINFTKKELAKLALKKSPILADITMQSEIMRNSVKKLLLQNIGKGLSFDQVVQGLKKIYPGYERNCYTVANTSLQHTYKDGSFSKTKELFQKFKYLGPDDNVTRAFCADHVGRVFEKKEAEQLQSEIMGFYNCRHSLEPVDEKLLSSEQNAIKKLNELPVISPGRIKSPINYTPMNIKKNPNYKISKQAWKDAGCFKRGL